MSDDPFAEPSDAETTIIRPRPARRRGPRSAIRGGARGRARAAEPAPAAAGAGGGRNPLVAAAAAGARRRGAHRRPRRDPDVERLKRGMVEAMREFEKPRRWRPGSTRARCAPPATRSAPPSTTSCSARPGAAPRSWAAAEHDQHLPQRGHRRRAVLRNPRADAARTSATTPTVVELMYLCTVARLRGPLPRLPRGIAALTELRDGVYRDHPPAARRFRARAVAALARARGRRIGRWRSACRSGSIGLVTRRPRLRSSTCCSPSRSPTPPTSRSPSCPPCRRRACRSGAAPGGARRRRHRRPRRAAPATAAATPSLLDSSSSPRSRPAWCRCSRTRRRVTVRLINRNMFGSGAANAERAVTCRCSRASATALNAERGNVLGQRLHRQPADPHARDSRRTSQLSQARAEAVAKAA